MFSRKNVKFKFLSQGPGPLSEMIYKHLPIGFDTPGRTLCISWSGVGKNLPI